MKRVYIVVDNYKLERYKATLTDAGFIDFYSGPFDAKTTAIFVDMAPADVAVIEALCRMNEVYFSKYKMN